MKVVIFGTGCFFHKYKKFIDIATVDCLLDNSETKNHTIIEGKMVYYPNEINLDECDYVLIMIERYSEVVQQLLCLGVTNEKIKTYRDIAQLYNMTLEVQSNAGMISLEEWVGSHKKKIFILSHSSTRSGVPIALMNLSVLLRKMGWAVLYGSMEEGNISLELQKNNVDYVENLQLWGSFDKLRDSLQKFDMLIVGTLVLSEQGVALAKLNIPILWWLHESDRNLFEHHLLPTGNENIHYYAVGNRVVNCFREFYPDEPIDNLLYFLLENNWKQRKKSDCFTFACIGWYGKGKGQDILLKAIELMTSAVRKKMRVIMVAPGWDTAVTKPKQMIEVQWIGEISQEEIEMLYNNIDVLVCPSRCDSMPIVVSQALQNHIPCIVSDQVGQSVFFEHQYGGYVFENENASQLAERMTYCINNPEVIKTKGEEAYDIFKCNFSEQIMKQKIEEIIKSYGDS